ncbi:MAG TPA: hypothetical protein VJR50_23850 [Mycobacterium sp.]|nr:hypothetical protein [Mycobacterium sp.]
MAAPTVQLTAQTVTLPSRAALAEWLAAAQRQSPDLAGAAAPVGAQQAGPTAGLLAFPGLGNAIIGAYDLIEPWVAYGVDVADWALGWIPFGWVIGDQINIFYDSFEPAVQSIFYNLGSWIGGSISFWEGLNNVVLDGANSFIRLANMEIAYGLGFLPPLPFPPPQIPYLPWFGLLQAQTAGVSADALAPDVGVQNAASDLVNAIYTPVSNTITYGVDVLQAALAPIPLLNIAGDQASILWNVLADPIADSFVYDLIDPVLNQPLNINSYLNGAYDVGATTVNALINTGLAEANYFLGVPLAAASRTDSSRTAEVSTVPSLVKTSLADSSTNGVGTAGQAPSGPSNDLTKTVHNVRNEIRSAFTDRRGVDAADVGNDVVRAQGNATGGTATAASDKTKSGRPENKAAADAAKAPTNVVKSLGDAARKVVDDVRQAAKNSGDASKDRSTAGEDTE